MQIHNLRLNYFNLLTKESLVYDLNIFNDDFEFNQKIYYFKSFIMYLIFVQIFNEILLFKQYYGINDVDNIKIMINTIIMVITVVLKLFQHHVMQPIINI